MEQRKIVVTYITKAMYTMDSFADLVKEDCVIDIMDAETGEMLYIKGMKEPAVA